MKSVIKFLGILVFGAVMYSVPVVTVLSIVLNWNGFLQLICILSSILQFILLICKIAEDIEEI